MQGVLHISRHGETTITCVDGLRVTAKRALVLISLLKDLTVRVADPGMCLNGQPGICRILQGTE